MDWNFLLASRRGRINLKPFWIATATIYGLGIGLVWASYYAAAHYGVFNAFEFFGIVNSLVSLQFFLMCPLIIKRLHDRDHSAWWLVPVWIMPQAYLFFGQHYLDALKGSLPGLEPISNFVVVVVFGWAVFELAFLRGTLGQNRFGADPLPLRFRSEVWNRELRSAARRHALAARSFLGAHAARIDTPALPPLFWAPVTSLHA